MNIKLTEGETQVTRIMATFRKNRKHYLQEALGLAIFMISACFFSAQLEGKYGSLHGAIPNANLRLVIMGFLMGYHREDALEEAERLRERLEGRNVAAAASSERRDR
jgi:hypothetical protein